MSSPIAGTRPVALVSVAVLVLATVPAIGAAEQNRAGGTVVVGPNETVTDDLTAAAGTVVVRGTVEGDLQTFAGNVLVAEGGRVDGDCSAFAGNVRVAGEVTGDVDAASGNLVLADTGTVGGSLEGAAGYVSLAGTVTGDAEVSAETLALADGARVGGDLTYDAERFERSPGATVGGTVRQEDLGRQFGPAPAPRVPNWLGAVYGFLVNLLLGALLLAVFPTFSNGVADRVRRDPLLSAGAGLLLLVLVPLALVVVAVTVIGIPISLLGALLFVVVLWAAAVYGSFAVGVWLLSFAGGTNRWLALLVGLVVVALLTRIPILGGVVQFLVLLLGLGALAMALLARYRGRRDAPERSETPRDADEEPSPA